MRQLTHSFGVLMVELFEDAEVCLATARQMEHATTGETLAKLQLQLEAELQKQRVLSYQTQRMGTRDDDMLGLVPAEEDSEEDDWRHAICGDQLPWRGLSRPRTVAVMHGSRLSSDHQAPSIGLPNAAAHRLCPASRSSWWRQNWKLLPAGSRG